MNRKASVLILFLWVLLFLSLFAVSLTTRTRLATKIESHRLNHLRLHYDFLSALNLARFFIGADENPQFDSKKDAWFGIPTKFRDMAFSEHFELTITDEGSKINLNFATERILLALFSVLKDHDMALETDPKELAANILRWRGTSFRHATGLGGSAFKGAPFESVDELRLIPGIVASDAERLAPFVTVFGHRKKRNMAVNINTVHPYVLESLVASLPAGSHSKEKFLEHFNKLSQSSSPSMRDRRKTEFAFDVSELTADAMIRKLELPRTLEMRLLLGRLLVFLTVDSRFFLVSVRSKRSRTNNVALRAVLGPDVSYPKTRLAMSQLGLRTLSTPLEILSWKEGIS